MFAGLTLHAAVLPQSVREPNSRHVRTSVTGLLGWSVGAKSTAFGQDTFLEAAVKTDAAGLGFIEGFSTQKVSPEIPQNLDSQLSAAQAAEIKSALQALKLRMIAYHVESLGPDSHKDLDFAKSLGASLVVAAGYTGSLADLDKLAAEAGMNVALENGKDLTGAGSHVGLSADSANWKGATDKLMALTLRTGTNTKDLLLDIAKHEPPPQEDPTKCGNCSRPYGGTRPLFIALEPESGGFSHPIDAFEKAARYAMGYRVEQDSKFIPITSTDRVPAAERQAIEAALPKTAPAKPKKARKLLVVDICPAGAYYHMTSAHANLALELMAKNTGAYEPIFSNDLNNLKYPKIKQYDAVFLNSADGPVFADPDVLSGLMRFVREGGGVAGVHGSSYASMDVSEFGELIGAADGPHKVEQATLKIDDPDSPLTKQFKGKGFEYTDEFYHFLPTGPYSREKLHVLISIDAAKSDLSKWKVRPDNDYGLVWIKSYGKGRVFNCAMGHTPTLFANPGLAEMMLAGIQFVLGDLPADTTPSAKLTSAKK